MVEAISRLWQICLLNMSVPVGRQTVGELSYAICGPTRSSLILCTRRLLKVSWRKQNALGPESLLTAALHRMRDPQSMLPRVILNLILDAMWLHSL